MNWTLWQKILDVLYRFRLWVADRWTTKGPLLLGGLLSPEVSYWSTDDVAVLQYKLLQFSGILAGFGMPLLEVPADPLDVSRPGIPPDFTPVLYLRAPPTQELLLLETDGNDPTHVNDDSDPIAPGGEARRLLSMLRVRGLILGWSAFVDNGGVGIHVQMDRTQATAWYSLIAWQDKVVLTGSQKTDKQAWA